MTPWSVRDRVSLTSAQRGPTAQNDITIQTLPEIEVCPVEGVDDDLWVMDLEPICTGTA